MLVLYEYNISISIRISIRSSIRIQRPQKLIVFQLEWLHSFKVLRPGLISAAPPGRLDIKEGTAHFHCRGSLFPMD